MQGRTRKAPQRENRTVTTVEEVASQHAPARSSRQFRPGEWLIEGLIRFAGVSTIIIIGLIFLFLLREGLPAFLDIPLLKLFGVR